VKADSIDENAYYAARNTGDYDMVMGSLAIRGPSPYYAYNSLLNSANTADIGQSAKTNWERWQDSNTDKLLNQLAATTDPTVKQQTLNGLQKIMVEQQPVVLLLNHPSWFVYSTKSFTGFPDKNNPYALGAAYQVPDNEQVVLHLKPA
jgi:peptide/nickel transport system substrate-binding protein